MTKFDIVAYPNKKMRSSCETYALNQIEGNEKNKSR